MPKTPRQGILAAGNFIVDYVKVIDGYPTQDMLASILSESRSNGGGPYNVLKDLAAMKAPFPSRPAGWSVTTPMVSGSSVIAKTTASTSPSCTSARTTRPPTRMR